MNRSTRLTAILLVPMFAAVAAAQGPKPYVRCVEHSQINFVASSRLIDAQGYWERWDAEIQFDPAAVDKSSVNITIDPKSINTRVEMRDRDLRSRNFFWADSFPVITFRSKTVNAPGGLSRDSLMANSRLVITGDLTIRGHTKTIAVPTTLVFFDRRANQGRVKGKFTVLRKEYDVSFDPPMNPVANEVEVQFDISFRAPQP